MHDTDFVDHLGNFFARHPVVARFTFLFLCGAFAAGFVYAM